MASGDGANHAVPENLAVRPAKETSADAVREWDGPRALLREESAFFRAMAPGEPTEAESSVTIAELLHQLRDLLAEPDLDTRFVGAGGPSRWRRAGTPLVEIQVRQPDTPADRARLHAMARALDRLLTREEDHDLDR